MTQSNTAEDLNVEQTPCGNKKSLIFDLVSRKGKRFSCEGNYATIRSQLQTNGEISKDYHKCMSFGAVSKPTNRRVTRRWRASRLPNTELHFTRSPRAV